jgi:hypothetical protein
VGFFKRLMGREEEEASPFGTPADAQIAPAAPSQNSGDTPFLSFHSHPVETTWSSVTVNGKQLDGDQAQAFSKAFESLGNLASLGASQVIDLRGHPELRQKVLGAMGDHPNDPAALQNAVMEALQAAGVTTGGTSPTTPPAAHEAEDPLDRLRKLDELHKSGALTDEEFTAQKKKLLEEL